MGVGGGDSAAESDETNVWQNTSEPTESKTPKEGTRPVTLYPPFGFSSFGQKVPTEEVKVFPVLDPENAGLLFKFPTGSKR